MSRVIKFRAWDGDEITNEFSLYSDGKIASRVGTFSPKPLILMQFTGLYDLHGKEIYEKDRIRYGAIDADGNTHEMKGTIEWDSEECGFVVESDSDKWPIIAMRFVIQKEIIGNAYETPDLISSK